MAESRRKRPTRKHVALATAAVVFVLTSYLGSWLSMHWLLGHGTIGPTTFMALQSTVFAPMELYCDSDLPGSQFLADASEWSELIGGGMIVVGDTGVEWIE